MQSGWLAMNTSVSFMVLEFEKLKIEMIETLLPNGILLLRLSPFPVIFCNLMSKKISLDVYFLNKGITFIHTGVCVGGQKFRV